MRAFTANAGLRQSSIVVVVRNLFSYQPYFNKCSHDDILENCYQIEKIIPKVSETISDLETRIDKSEANAKNVQLEIIQV